MKPTVQRGESMEPLGKRLARGDVTAFGELYDACADRLYRYLTVRLRSADAASDVVQTVFLRAVSNRRQLAKAENLTAYLFGIARNEATNQIKRRRRAAQYEGIYRNDDVAAKDELSPDDAEIATAALEKLEDNDRELVELKIFSGLTFQEISDVTGWPLGTVATRYRRALESLRGWLAKQMQ